ncbi:MAG: hypothetical protein JRF37_11395 [Deltaproteobacteria bacterium]|nr:hypothetical protein [Deltaproteobacteria bacterium]
MELMGRIRKHGIILMSLLFLLGIMNCGGARKQAQAPESLIKDYIAKHETMVDLSLADLYIEKEQKSVTGKINLEIEKQKHAGTLQKMQHASFDFSNLRISLVDQKEEYVDDEPKAFLKVAANGNIAMKTEENSKNIPIDEVIILEKEGKSWKVTETINPWG